MFLTLAFWTQLILSGISSFIYPSKVNEGSLSPYCPPTVPSYTVDLSVSPTGIWNSPSNVGRNDQCNCTSGTESCLEFVITLNPNAIGFVLRKTAGSQAGGNQDYLVNGDCSNIGTLDERFCVTGTGPYYIAYCESGGNTHTYQVESIESDFLPASFCAEPGIATQLTVSGSVDPLSASWTAVSSNASTSFLTASSGTLSTYFNPPDTISKNQIFTYEVCANSNISICDNVIPICTTVDVHFYDVIPNSANWVNPPGTITITCDQAENYVIPNLSYTNGETGDKLISGSVPGVIKSGRFDECGGQWIIEWSYTNACTGTITHQQVINIDPAPTANWVNPPADMTITCDEAANYVIPNLSYSNGESGSCEISGSVQGIVSGYFNECGGSFIITWTFTDDCSRTINHTQQITINPAPTSSWIYAPGPLELTCDEAQNYAIPDLSYTNGESGSCEISGTVAGVIQSGSFTVCGGSWVLLWEYTDDCGNRIENTQDVNILPAAPPRWINPPAATTISCAQAENYVIPNLSYSNGESGSCEISGSVQGIVSGYFNECGGSWVLLWEYTDDCGTTINHTQDITIDPAYGPQFINPPANDTLTVEEFQNYQIPNLEYTNAESGSCLIQGQVAGKLISGGASSCCGNAIILWDYTDDCSRQISHTQQIVIVNSSLTPQAQWINPPAPTTITCSDALTFTAPSLSYSNNTSDSCLISGSVAPTISSNFTECGGTITVDWDFTDECGRNIHHTQTVTVEPAPSQDWINPPGNITISCDAALSFTAPALFYTNGESSTCEIAGSVSPVVTTNFTECGGTITVDWDFTDNCGRNHHHTQIVTVEPAPTPAWINPPGPISISCFEATIYTAPDLNYTNGGSSSCKIAGSVTPSIIPNFDECGGTINVDWDFTDNCGRNIHFTQVIIVEEAPAPSWINPPMDDTISCTEANNYVIPSLAYSNGNNGTCNIEGSIAGTISGAYEDCTGGWIVQWSYTDNCGRSITHFQSITTHPDWVDTDGDGISDEFDLCPNTLVEEINNVDSNGCAISQISDDDKDGVYNNQDLCPNTPEQLKYLVDSNGCAPFEIDWDGDGVINKMDKDSLNPCLFDIDSITLVPSADWLASDCDEDGATNNIEGIGDVDGDGIPNFLDLDSDGDGILDSAEISVVCSQDNITYLNEVFAEVNVQKNIKYGTNISILTGSPAPIDLKMDVYTPKGDNNSIRPTVIYLHTGDFLPPLISGKITGSLSDSSVVEICTRLAKMGYTAIAATYRQGWLPTSENQNVRRKTLLQAIYRGIIDVRSCIRYLRKSAFEDGNPYGVDTEKIAVWGQGTGGFLSLGAGVLDHYEELLVEKFIDTITSEPYISLPIDGDPYGLQPAVLNIPNHVGYSSDFNLSINMGGALGDINWIEGENSLIEEPAMVGFHVVSDPFVPFGDGPVIVPTTQEFVVNVSGTLTANQKINEVGANDVLAPSLQLNDILTTRVSLIQLAGITVDLSALGGSATTPLATDHMYPFILPGPGPQSGPWDWWDKDRLDLLVAGFNAATGAELNSDEIHANNLITNPDMSAEKARAYIDTIMAYFSPRACFALNLSSCKTALLGITPESPENQDFNNCFLPDSDEDGIPNFLDLDEDGDGVLDSIESFELTDRMDPCSFFAGSIDTTIVSDIWKVIDCDGDGVSNGQELADNSNPVDNCDFLIDSFSIDFTDAVWRITDCDSDGISNVDEMHFSTSDSLDLDNDGIPNYLDWDSDGDGQIDSLENILGTNAFDLCSFILTEIDTLIASDYWKNLDCNSNGISNIQEVRNLNQTDICDQEIDYINSVPPTEWNNADCDGDGELNYLEAINGTDPYDACSRYSSIPSPPQWINPQSNISLSCEEALEFSSFNLSYTTSTGETCIQAGTIVASKSANYGSCGEDWVLTWSFTDLFGLTIQHQQTISVSEQECSSSDNDLDIPEIALQSQTIASKKNIRSRGRINNGSKVNFFAGESIILRPGFRVSAGAEFSARIQDCIEVPSNTNSSIFNADIESPVTTSIQDLRIYPNPFTSAITIEVDGASSPTDINVYSIQGQLIRSLKSTEMSRLSVDLSFLESGVYVVKVVGKDFTESRRIVKRF